MTARVAPRRVGPAEKFQAGVHQFLFVFGANFKALSIQVSKFRWSPLSGGFVPTIIPNSINNQSYQKKTSTSFSLLPACSLNSSRQAPTLPQKDSFHPALRSPGRMEPGGHKLQTTTGKLPLHTYNQRHRCAGGRTVMPTTNILRKIHTERQGTTQVPKTHFQTDSTFLKWKYTHVQHKQIHLLEAKVSHM